MVTMKKLNRLANTHTLFLRLESIKIWNKIQIFIRCHNDATNFGFGVRTVPNPLHGGRHCIQANPDVFYADLQQCTNMKSLEEGKRVHAHLIKTGFETDVFLQNNLVNMYAKCGSLSNARHMFDNISEKNLISWTAMIAGYGQHKHGEEALGIFIQMERSGIKPDQFTFTSVLRVCSGLAALEEGKQIHSHTIKYRLGPDVFVGTALLGMYATCESLECARQVFDEITERNVVSWTAMITGYVRHRHGKEALEMFCEMQQAGTKPNHYAFSSVFKVCASFGSLELGRQIHAITLKTGSDSHIFVGNALVDMYAKCRNVKDSHKVFDKMVNRDMVSWNAIIAGCALVGQRDEALDLLCQMLRTGMKADRITLGNILHPCASPEALELGKQVHAHIIKVGFELDIFVGTVLFSMYAKCGRIEDARKVFDNMPERDEVSWDAMLSGYSRHQLGKEAIQLFQQMQLVGMELSCISLVCVLDVCASPEALELGKQLYAYIIKSEFESNVIVGTALVDMYSKCGSIEDARVIFDKMPEQDLVSWNAMIAGYAQHGCSEEALQLCEQMQLTGIKPDRFTFASVLSACAMLADLEQGNQVHAHIIKIGSELDVFVGNALLDMYAKCGSIEDACKMFDNMHERDVVSWTAMIVGYSQHGHGKEALLLFEQMQQAGIEPNHITFLGVLSACSRVGLLDEGRHYFNSMSQNHDITPIMDHYACMVDLFGRAGCLDEAEDFINRMPFKPDAVVWKTLLAACRIHGNIELGKHAAECVLELEPQDNATYVLLSNIYAEAGRWEDVTEVRKLMNARGVRKEPGCSWIEVYNTVNAFVVGDKSHPQAEQIYGKLETLTRQMREAGYVPNRNFLLHDLEADQM